jgi:ParB family chromosome partitioning protein
MEILNIALNIIRPNPSQPREKFNQDSLQDLANSLLNGNIVQPIVVRKNGNGYQIIAGERRWRAAQLAGFKTIPAIVKEVPENRILLESLIENLNRKNLTDPERENAIHELWNKHKELGFKKKSDLAKALGLRYDDINSILESWEFRHKEKEIPYSIPTYIISRTKGLSLKNRKKIIEKVHKGELQAKEAYTAIKVLRHATEPIKQAILEGSVSPEIAEEIVTIKKPEIREQALYLAQKGVYSKTGLKKRIEQFEKPQLEIPTMSIGVQVFNKTMWNLERIGKYDFYTIGYENKNLDQVIQLLKKKKIKTLIDVRKNAVSVYKKEFNKKSLQVTIENNNIEYFHIPDLGVPSKIRRQLYKTKDYDLFFKWYDNNILNKGILESSEFELLNYPIAIMCMELDPTKCHRHRISLALEKKGLKGYDL